MIHKLNEFAKKNKYFDEDYDHDYDQKYDEFQVNHGAKNGGSHKKGHQADTYDRSLSRTKGTSKKGHNNNSESGLIDMR